MIAKRYNVSVAAICAANEISRRSAIKPGQLLRIPEASDKDGRTALSERKQGKSVEKVKASKTASPKQSSKSHRTASKKKLSWRKYRRPARRAGYVALRATGRRWSGYALVKGNKISGNGRNGFRHALYSWRTGAEIPIDSRLIRILVRVSDTFGGRPLRIASGHRERSFARESKHKLGRACDFSVVGVPNEAVRDYLKTLGGLGVGYYPHSSFVHVDVRKSRTTWVDYSRPGERPKYKKPTPQRRPRSRKRASAAGSVSADKLTKKLNLAKRTSF